MQDLKSRLRNAELEAMGRLAGGVAHDFNNILTSILGYAVLIENESVDRAGAAHAAEIRKASERAASLTAQLLAFSHQVTAGCESGSQPSTAAVIREMLAGGG